MQPICEPQNPCGPTATPAPMGKAPCPTLTFCAGNYQFSYVDGCLIKQKIAKPVEDGWYSRVRVVDGCIVEGGQAADPVTVLQGPCVQANSGSAGTIALHPSPCNLLELTSGGMLANLSTLNSEYVNLTGCGTDGSPLQADINTALLREAIVDSEFDLNSCGMVIERGIVKQFPASVITSVVANIPGLSFEVIGCQLRISTAVTTTAFIASTKYMRMFCCNGSMYALGQVKAGPGVTATVEICPVVAGNAVPTPPGSFQTAQIAAEWLDAQVIGCPAPPI